VLTRRWTTKRAATAGRISFCRTRRAAIAELVNGDARRALNTLEMMADMAEVDDRVSAC
jgi:replication-associated recombination protein RarA